MGFPYVRVCGVIEWKVIVDIESRTGIKREFGRRRTEVGDVPEGDYHTALFSSCGRC